MQYYKTCSHPSPSQSMIIMMQVNLCYDHVPLYYVQYSLSVIIMSLSTDLYNPPSVMTMSLCAMCSTPPL